MNPWSAKLQAMQCSLSAGSQLRRRSLGDRIRHAAPFPRSTGAQSPRLAGMELFRHRLVEPKQKLGLLKMLKWALIFLVISIVAGAFGFTGIAAGAATIARVLFGLFLLLALLFLILLLTGVNLVT